MRAVVLNKFGGVGNARLGQREHPGVPREWEVTVKVSISGLNFHDLLQRVGATELGQVPPILGTECIGTVTAIGSEVGRCQLGDLVFALPTAGAWTEYLNIPETQVWPVTQPNIELSTLASTLPYLLADLLLKRVANSETEEKKNILVFSAGGSVGSAIKDLANLKGCNVIGVASSGKIPQLEGFFHLIPRETGDLEGEIKKITPTGVDYIFDGLAGDHVTQSISTLTPTGTYTLFSNSSIITGDTKKFLLFRDHWAYANIPTKYLYDQCKTLSGFHLGNFIKAKPDVVEKSLEFVWELMAGGKIEPLTDLTFHFENIQVGMQRMHERKNVGKIIIKVEVPSPEVIEIERGLAKAVAVKTGGGPVEGGVAAGGAEAEGDDLVEKGGVAPEAAAAGDQKEEEPVVGVVATPDEKPDKPGETGETPSATIDRPTPAEDEDEEE